MNVFQHLYSESKKLAKAAGEGPSYLSPNCTVKLNDQPIERVKASAAYQACSNNLGALIRNTKLEMRDIELEMMILNCNGRKNELMEIMSSASALSLISCYVIVVYELDVDHNDLASSFLIKHHEELLDLSATPLGMFRGKLESSSTKIVQCPGPVKFSSFQPPERIFVFFEIQVFSFRVVTGFHF